MRLIRERDARVPEREAVAQLTRFEDGSIEARPRERISEAVPQAVQDVAACVNGYRRFNRLRDGPQFVDAMTMIGVGVRDDDPREPVDLRREQLLPQVRAAIDQHALPPALD